MDTAIQLVVDGVSRGGILDTRTTLLDALRDHFGITAPKKGCDHGQCGACTVLLDGRRVNSCLALAVACEGSDVVTAAGLGDGDSLHPVQTAFLEYDAFQCGFCTPGQVCSAVGMLRERAAGSPAYVAPGAALDGDSENAEIRERMGGNLCRCGAYPNILAAIKSVVTS